MPATAARRALRKLSSSSVNRQSRRPPNEGDLQKRADEVDGKMPPKRRKRNVEPLSPELTPELSSPLKRLYKEPINVLDENSDLYAQSGTDAIDAMGFCRDDDAKAALPRRIVRSGYKNNMGTNLQREIGVSVQIPWSVNAAKPKFMAKAWQYETANFYTMPKDRHVTENIADDEDRDDHTIPFCTASCNSGFPQT